MKRLLKWIGLAESSFYYRPTNGIKGSRPTEYTYHMRDGMVSEKQVLNDINKILSHEFIDCGYHLMTAYLRQDGYTINPKKVYRIMRSAGLLKPDQRIKRNSQGKKYVKYRIVKTAHPMDCLEMDIKMVWIPQKGKNAYLLSVIDVHTRKILGYRFAMQMKQVAVIELLSDIFDHYTMAQFMIIRSDNGSQFIANNVREYISLMGISQEFTHVATPEENAHIEAYHGTLKRDLFDRFEYRTMGEIEQIIKRYVSFYNNVRLHGLLGKITPNEKWRQDENKIPTRKKIA